jgi:hypothetical protein
MKGRVGFIPGTDANTYTAAGTELVSDALFCTFFDIVGPFFITVIHDLITKGNRPGRAVARTLFAFGAEILNPEINGLIYVKGEIGGNDGSFKSRP